MLFSLVINFKNVVAVIFVAAQNPISLKCNPSHIIIQFAVKTLSHNSKYTSPASTHYSHHQPQNLTTIQIMFTANNHKYKCIKILNQTIIPKNLMKHSIQTTSNLKKYSIHNTSLQSLALKAKRIRNSKHKQNTKHCAKSLALKVLHTSYGFQIGTVCLPLNGTVLLAEVTLGNGSTGMSKGDSSEGMYTPYPSGTLLPLPLPPLDVPLPLSL